MNPLMTYSRTGLALTKRFEGCRLTAYPDTGGVWTIGYGHTHGVREGTTCTREQAQAWLKNDIQATSDAVSRLVRISLKPSELDALVDFVFNLGAGAFARATMLKDLNAGNLAAAAMRRGVTAFPVVYRGERDPEPLGELLLGEIELGADGAKRGGQSLGLLCHVCHIAHVWQSLSSVPSPTCSESPLLEDDYQQNATLHSAPTRVPRLLVEVARHNAS